MLVGICKLYTIQSSSYLYYVNANPYQWASKLEPSKLKQLSHSKILKNVSAVEGFEVHMPTYPEQTSPVFCVMINLTQLMIRHKHPLFCLKFTQSTLIDIIPGILLFFFCAINRLSHQYSTGSG